MYYRWITSVQHKKALYSEVHGYTVALYTRELPSIMFFCVGRNSGYIFGIFSWRRSIVVRTLVSAGERTFPILRQTASWMCDYLAVKPSAIGQPTWPTQPSVPQGSVNE